MPEQDVVVSDMDDTLLATDLTKASMRIFARRKPMLLPILLVWYVMGKSVAKAKLAKHAMPNVLDATVNTRVLDYLKAEKEKGAWLVLASASNIKIVRAVADRIGLFDQVLGSVPGDDFKGSAKADGLDREFGAGNYTYIGDCLADLKVWSRAKKAVSFHASEALRSRIEQVTSDFEHL